MLMRKIVKRCITTTSSTSFGSYEVENFDRTSDDDEDETVRPDSDEDEV